jgi:hypothetical protein
MPNRCVSNDNRVEATEEERMTNGGGEGERNGGNERGRWPAQVLEPFAAYGACSTTNLPHIFTLQLEH